jgi:hypothetical protein
VNSLFIDRIGDDGSGVYSLDVHRTWTTAVAACALVLTTPRVAGAQPEPSPPALPPLPPPTDEPPVGSSPAPSSAPAPPPPVEAPPPVTSAPVPEEAPPEATHVPSFADIPKLLVVSAGLGLAISDVQGNTPTSAGFYANTEVVLVPSMWFSPRAYAGVLFTSTDASTCPTPGCDVHASIGFLGVKGRLTIPIPYVAPFLEAGVGASVGNLTTRVYDTDVDFTGVTYHVPFAIGLSIGSMHDYVVDLGLSYLWHPAQSQFGGGYLLSVAFSLR